MNRQISPGAIIRIIIAVFEVVGLAVFFFGCGSSAPKPSPSSGPPGQVTGKSPDQQMQMRIKQMQQGGGANGAGGK